MLLVFALLKCLKRNDIRVVIEQQSSSSVLMTGATGGGRAASVADGYCSRHLA